MTLRITDRWKHTAGICATSRCQGDLCPAVEVANFSTPLPRPAPLEVLELLGVS